MSSKERYMSDSMRCGVILACSGGCMDAYSYLLRDNVFANAQTGNLLLFGINMVNGEITEAMHYMWPIFAFICGISIPNIVRHNEHKFGRFDWRQIAVVVEAVILSGVAFLSNEYNELANALISFACGIQVESFRTVHNNTVATTMCIGNLRSGTYNLTQFLYNKDRRFLRKAVMYYGIIFSFVMGAVLESFLLKGCGQWSILASSMLLVVVFILLSIKTDDCNS